MKAKRLPSTFEITLLVVFIVLFLLLRDFRQWRWQGNYGDTAYFQEITQSLTKGYWFRSHFGGSISVDFQHVLQNPVASSFNQVPDFSLSSQPSQFYNHAYLILIPLALLTYIFNYRMMIDSLLVILTLAPFAMLWFTLRRNSLKASRSMLGVVGVLAVIVLVCFPGINYLALGQFYPDRFIILFLPVTMLAIESLGRAYNRRIFIIFIIFALLSASVTERGSLYVVLITFAAVFFRVVKDIRNFEEVLRRNISILLVGVVALAWSVIYIRKISRNTITGGFSDSFTHFSLVHNPMFTMPSLKLILLCLPILLIVGRYLDLLIVSAVSLLPNLLGTYMFNLRTAWFAHYMSYLTATLIGAILIAVRRDIQRHSSHPESISTTIDITTRVTLAAVLSILSVFLINPVTETKLIEPSKQVRLGTFTEAELWWSTPSYRKLTKQVINADNELANSIPKNSSVVATELTSPFVGGRVRYVDYYPVNLKVDDYVLIFSASPIGQPFIASPVTNYASPAGSQEMTVEATQLLNSDCYEIVNRIVNANLYLFHRIKEITDDSVCQPRNG